MGLSLREAATETGTSKSTILRAIRAGRMSAERLEGGGYSIDPAELFRVYPAKSDATVQDRAAHHAVGQDATVHGTAESADATGATADILIRNARLEAELAATKALLEIERQRVLEWQSVADRWAQQAERLALPAPAPTRSRCFRWLSA
jgi:excisionase family DNA binding protein